MATKTKPKKPTMSVAEANANNPGGGNFIEAAARRKAAHEAMVAEVCEELGIADKLEALRALPVEDKKTWLMQLNFAGLSISDAGRLLGIGGTTANRWFHENPEEMQRLVRASLSAESLKEVGPTWARLQSLRFSGNAETSRKASLDVLAVAGMAPNGPAGITVNVNARNAHLSVMPIADIEARLKELAALVGPTAEKIVEAELVSVKDLNGNRSGKVYRNPEVPAVAAGSPGVDQGPAGGAPPETDQPAD